MLLAKKGLGYTCIYRDNVAYHIDERDVTLLVALHDNINLVYHVRQDDSHSVVNPRAGTILFTAREVLNSKPYKHNLRHDLESLLYVLIWFALGYRPTRTPPADLLRKWREGDHKDVLQAKNSFLYGTEEEVYLGFMGINRSFKPLLFELVNRYRKRTQSVSIERHRFLEELLEKAKAYAEECREEDILRGLCQDDIRTNFHENWNAELSRLQMTAEAEWSRKSNLNADKYGMLSYRAWRDAIDILGEDRIPDCINDCCS